MIPIYAYPRMILTDSLSTEELQHKTIKHPDVRIVVSIKVSFFQTPIGANVVKIISQMVNPLSQALVEDS
ncbi:hypothetical protein ACFLXP_05080 [Chloroflexota bacterium]